MTYFSCKVTVEDAGAFKLGQAYVVGTATPKHIVNPTSVILTALILSLCNSIAA